MMASNLLRLVASNLRAMASLSYGIIIQVLVQAARGYDMLI